MGTASEMRVLIATDAWAPQVDGVVRTLTSLARSAPWAGIEIVFSPRTDTDGVAPPGALAVGVLGEARSREAGARPLARAAARARIRRPSGSDRPAAA